MLRSSCTLLFLCAALLLAACDHRAPESAFFGTWQIEDGCIDCTHLITLQPNHNVVGFSDSIAGHDQFDYRGRWYAGGELLVIHYDSSEKAESIIMRILDVAPDTIRVRWDGKEMRMTRSTRKPPQSSNQSMNSIAPFRREFRVFVATPCSELSLSR